MEDQPAANSSSTRKLLAQSWPWLVVLIILLFVGFIRVRLLDMPLERDEGEYAYAGQLILQGIPPYELAYSMKWPGTYYAYALGMAIFGQTVAGVHLTLLVVNSLTSIFVFFLGRKLFGVTAGLVACASYALMSVSPAVLGMAAHETQFVVMFAVPATLLLWRAAESHEPRTFFLSGLLYGMAILMEQPGIYFGCFGTLFLLWRAMRNASIFSRHFAGTILIFGASMVLPFACFCLADVCAGDFGRFWFWTINYASSYATSCTFAMGMQYLGTAVLTQLPVYFGFWVLVGAGLAAAFAKPKFPPESAFALVFLFFSFLGTSAGMYFRMHYFVLLLPAVAILAGMAVASLQSRLSQRAKIIPLLVFAGVLWWNIHYQALMFFRATPLQVCEAIYRSNPFIESVSVGQYLREHFKPDAHIAVVGSEPEIYFYSRRHSVTGYIYTYPLMEAQPYAALMQREMIDEIEAGRPEYIVLVTYRLSWLAKPTSDYLILNWVENYTEEYYKPVGFIGRRSDGQRFRDFGSNAASFHDSHDPLDQFIAIYKRKSDAD
jgi:Dolichyl-phosphate-mannose-protein mannosyltransferase